MVSGTKILIRSKRELYIEDLRVVHTRRAFSTPLAPSLSTSRPQDHASVPEQNRSSFLPVPKEITLAGLEEVLTAFRERN